MLRITTHIVPVKKIGEKIQFQIKLPDQTKKILSVQLTANPDIRYQNKSVLFPREIGWLWLRVSEKQDVFYCENFKLHPFHHRQSQLFETPIGSGGKGGFWVQGKQQEAETLNLSLETGLIEGYYIDRVGTRTTKKYELKLYLTLEE